MQFYFIGVTTKQSAITHILPMWSQALGIELDLTGIDLPINAAAAQYQRAILDIKNNSKALGAVITTHKLKIFEHGAHLFDDLDELTRLLKEICVITKQGSHLVGLASPDCLSSTFSLKNMLAKNHWRKYSSNVLCFGAGGVARSIVLSLLYDFESNAPLSHRCYTAPKKILLVDNDQQQLKAISSLLDPLKESTEIEYIHQTNAIDNDLLLANLPIGSLIINATGMGKDIPGSPLTDQAPFPPQSVVWDLNYRGERSFLQQAKSKELKLELKIHDGWLCFLHGWTQAISLALGTTFSDQQSLQLAKIAEEFRVAAPINN